MAEKRTYTVPLRRGFRNTERHQRTKKAVSVLRRFMQRHMKADDIKIGERLNRELWKDGIKKPPAKITVVTEKTDETVYVELEGDLLPSEIKAQQEEAEKQADKKADKAAKKEAESKKQDAAKKEAKSEKKPAAKEAKSEESSKKPAEKKEAKADTKSEKTSK